MVKLHKPTLNQAPLLKAAWERVLSLGELNHFRKQTLSQLTEDAASYLDALDDWKGGGELTLEDGSAVKRLPSITRYMWINGEPAGAISYRWQSETTELPPHVLGHIGYETFAWHRGKGFATSALAQILEFPRNQKMPFVELVTNIDNLASQKVITKNGGVLVEEFNKTESQGGAPAYRFRITL